MELSAKIHIGLKLLNIFPKSCIIGEAWTYLVNKKVVFIKKTTLFTSKVSNILISRFKDHCQSKILTLIFPTDSDSNSDDGLWNVRSEY